MNARSRGVSLIEALVALAVMAFGLLGVVGMQATLRFNSDVSRQRAEAVRMAQEQMESMRSFGVLSGATVPSDHEYVDIVSGSDAPAPPASFGNTTFSRTTTVLLPTANDPKLKVLQVEVLWLDRRTAAGGASEPVRLTSSIAEVAPELMASVGLPGDRGGAQRPLGRHPSIPQTVVPGATPGTSDFTPPGAATGVAWTFVNGTGQITNVCSAPGVCTAVSGWLVSGHIQFIGVVAGVGVAPTPAEAESPTGLAASYPGIGVQVNLTAPITPAVPPACYVTPASVGTAYYCFVPIAVTTASWSGRTVLNGGSFTPAISNLSSDVTASNFKVCRYTPQATHTPTGGNTAHPLDYTAVTSSLTNQNFLVFSAGDGSTAYTCPADDSTTPLINGTTFAHQPSV